MVFQISVALAFLAAVQAAVVHPKGANSSQQQTHLLPCSAAYVLFSPLFTLVSAPLFSNPLRILPYRYGRIITRRSARVDANDYRTRTRR